MRKSSLILVGAVCGAAVAFAVTGQGPVLTPAQAKSSPPPRVSVETIKRIALFTQVFEHVRARYVERPDDTRLIEAAISGMLASLDPHSEYMSAKSFSDVQVQTHGEFGGVGIRVTIEGGRPKVTAPIDGTPAARAGILADDVITHLDGQPLVGLTISQVADRMRGPASTTVRLTIERRGQVKPIELKIVRETIRVPSVFFHREGADVGYIRITRFNYQTADGLETALRELARHDLTGYVLDLRNNPGGLIDQAVTVAGSFLDKGEIVSLRGRDPADAESFDAATGRGDQIRKKPLIVLINGGSASSAEIVAGALQDHKRATILGTRSYGKGSVQTIVPLGGGNGGLRLTTARYFTPAGRSIQARGIVPDVEVAQSVPQQQAASFETRSEAGLRGHLKAQGGEEQGGSQAYVPADPADDKALQKALDLLRGSPRLDAAGPVPSTRVPVTAN
jgi:carboxyl-terminal processing protease